MLRQTDLPQARPSLVEDITEIILQYLLSNDREDTRNYSQSRKNLRKELCNYALISRNWRVPAQRIVFAEVDIKSSEKLRRLRYIMPVNTTQGLFLRGCVRSLRLWVNGTEKEGCLRPVDIPSTMRHFPSLYELRLDLYIVSSLGFDVLRDLKNTPSIQALMLTQPGRNTYGWKPTTNIDFQLLTQVPHWKLHRFVLGRGFQVECRKSPPPRHRFEEFRFHGNVESDGQKEYSSRGINWYLQNSKQTLQVFSTTCYGYVPSMLPLENNNQLRSAEFLQMNEGLSAHVALKGLKELMWIYIDPYSWRGLLPMYVISQIKGLVHLGIEISSSFNWDSSMDAWIRSNPTPEWPSEQPLIFPPNLKRISFIGYRGRRYSRLFAQKRMQKALGDTIEIRLYNSLSEYKEAIPLKLIPRDYTSASSSKVADYSTMTRLVNQAEKRSHTRKVSTNTANKPKWKP
ncbi:hypothetical protein CPB86DRAFT_755616 [Serendipita vermifera]|nr:hypothetical protein CPB86DRAFT_755616 [Serendipita vermifera]